MESLDRTVAVVGMGLPTVMKSIQSSTLVTIEGTSHRHHKIAESSHVDVAWF
jgi:hypothetical protein